MYEHMHMHMSKHNTTCSPIRAVPYTTYGDNAIAIVKKNTATRSGESCRVMACEPEQVLLAVTTDHHHQQHEPPRSRTHTLRLPAGHRPNTFQNQTNSCTRADARRRDVFVYFLRASSWHNFWFAATAHDTIHYCAYIHM